MWNELEILGKFETKECGLEHRVMESVTVDQAKTKCKIESRIEDLLMIVGSLSTSVSFDSHANIQFMTNHRKLGHKTRAETSFAGFYDSEKMFIYLNY